MSEAPARTPSTREVARLLADIGVLLELNGSAGFRARAFANAARTLDAADVDLPALTREGRLTTLRGIGEGVAAVVTEFVQTGSSRMFDELRSATPIGMYELLKVPGLGAKRIHTLHRELGIDSLDALEAAANAGRVATLPGFGAKTERKILQGIPFARASGELRRYPEALEAAARLLEWVRERPGVEAAQIVGALRRRLEVVDRIELLAATREPADLLAAFVELGGSGEPVGPAEDASADAGSAEAGQSVTIRLLDGLPVRLRCVAPEGYVVASIRETGSAAHVAELAAIAAGVGGSPGTDMPELESSVGSASREAEVYERLGLSYIPPELREGLGEIEQARAGRVPLLVELDELTGTFHCHTTYSDGKATLEEMAAAARERGWSYLGIADHSQTASYAGGLKPAAVRRQQEEIDALNQRFAADGGPAFRLLKGIESDILGDGSLDYPDEVLESFDFIVASVHSAFAMPREQMTERILRAIRHPRLTMLGHPTGRLLLTRSGYEVDVEAVLAAAAEAGVVIEINANPHRLDLDWRHVRRAAELGILIAINPDAHSIAALDHVAFGINMARKAGLEARQVLNAWPLNEVLQYLGQRK